MLRSIKDLTSYPVQARDGQIGTACDALFDDRFWSLRYLVVDTGKWLPGRKVLVSPLHLRQPDIGLPKHSFPVDLTMKQIEESPDLSEDAPVSRRFETQFAEYYGQVPYWIGSLPFGQSEDPIYGSNLSESAFQKRMEQREEIQNCHLRSAHEVMGYEIKADDETFGKVEDFIISDESWSIHYMVADTEKWLPGSKHLLDLDWVDRFDWAGQFVRVKLEREAIEAAPEYDPHEPVNVDYMRKLYDYYGLPANEKALGPPPSTLSFA